MRKMVWPAESWECRAGPLQYVPSAHIRRGVAIESICSRELLFENKDEIHRRDALSTDQRCTLCLELQGLEPQDMMLRFGHILSPHIRNICGGDKACMRRFVSRIKEMGATYDDGHGWLTPSWNYGLRDLHWHDDDAMLSHPPVTKRDLYLKYLREADLKLVVQSLAHEKELQRLGRENWVDEVEDELKRRKEVSE